MAWVRKRAAWIGEMPVPVLPERVSLGKPPEALLPWKVCRRLR